MCWAQSILDSAANNRQAQAAQAYASLSDDELDETLLDSLQDTYILDTWCGDGDLLDQLLKQEGVDLGFGSVLGADTAVEAPVAQKPELIASQAMAPAQMFCQAPSAAPSKQQLPAVAEPAAAAPVARAAQLAANQTLVSQLATPLNSAAQVQGLAAQQQMMMAAQGMMLPQQAQAAPALPPQVQAAASLLQANQLPPLMQQAAQVPPQMQMPQMAGGAPNMGYTLPNMGNPMMGNPMMNMNMNPFAAQMAQMAQMFAQQATLMKGAKTQADIDEAIERVKKKRRESAQRSRARKNTYMHALEIENNGLKDENNRLRQALGKYVKDFQNVASPWTAAHVNHSASSASTEQTSKCGAEGSGCNAPVVV